MTASHKLKQPNSNTSDTSQHDHQDHRNHQNHHAHMVADFRKRFWIALILTIPILILSPMIQQFLGIAGKLSFSGDLYVNLLFSSLVFFYGGSPFLKGLFEELKNRQPGMMTLIALAISVSYFYSAAVVLGISGRLFFWELATLVDIMLLGHWIEMKSVMGASRAVEELVKLMPSTAHRIMDNGNTEDVKVEELSKGDKILIKPGEKVPVDGKIFEGETSVNEAMVTGESKPVSRGKDDEVIGGSVNGDGSIKVAVEKMGNESYLSQVIEMVREAQQSKSRAQDLANRAAFWLTIVALSTGTITLFTWLLLVGQSFNFSLTRAVTVMVITCPHALGLAIPLVIAVSTALSAKNGLLIRNRTAFEKARNLEAIIFDKTGTLTKGEFGVSETVVFDEKLEEMELLNLAAAVESESEHPLARAIVDAAESPRKVKEFKAIPGKGAMGRVDGNEVKVVSPAYLKEQNTSYNEEKVQKLEDEGKTVVMVVSEETVVGAVALADIIREESKEAIRKLSNMNIKTIMLTGDSERVASWVAGELGIDTYFAGVLPDKKAEKVKEVQKDKSVVAMTGDGINDAPALAQADVGIAIGAGTDVAAETADIILVRSNPLDAVSIVEFSRATYRKMIQNLFWATGYNAVAIPLAAGVLASLGILLSPAVGAILMSASTVIVAINAKFLDVDKADNNDKN
jgi:Cu2+-exporting ATPase